MQKDSINEKGDFLTSTLWFNPEISDTELFFPNWYNHGIIYISDVLSVEGHLLSQTELEIRYSLKINFLHYFRIKNFWTFSSKNKNM